MAWSPVQSISTGECYEVELCASTLSSEQLWSSADALTDERNMVHHLKLSNMKDSTSLSAFARALSHPQCKVTELVLNKCQIVAPEVWGSFVNTLSCADIKVKRLDFVRVQVSPELSRTFAEALSRTTCKIRSMTIRAGSSKNRWATFFQHLKDFSVTGIKKLNISSPRFSLGLFQGIADMVQIPGTMLSSLTISIGSTRPPGTGGLEIVANAFTSSNNKVTTLKIKGGTGGQWSFIPALKTCLMHPNNKIVILGLTSNAVGPKDLSDLLPALKDPECKVEDLDLQDNHRLGSNDAKRLADLLASPGNKIHKLNMASTDIGDQGVNAIAEALMSEHNSLHALNLCGDSTLNDSAALGMSLRSKHNKLRILQLHTGFSTPTIGRAAYKPIQELLQAVRCSNINTFELFAPWGSEPLLRLQEEPFIKPWFHVMCTLVSIRTIQRLGRESPCQVLPLETFMPKIVETLGWEVRRMTLY